MHFVTDDDPFDGGDFRLSDLIRGDIDDGFGWSRNSGMWTRHYIPVLDYENHLPTDEGDLRPWGGQYVWSIPNELENLALSFWEDLVLEYHFGENDVYWSDFLSWVSNET
jgi:hypothetical protein